MPLNRRQTRFLIRFFVLLVLFYLVIGLAPGEKYIVEPFNRLLASLSGGILNLFGENVVVTGSVIRGSSFAVDIESGCNALEAVVFLAAAICAFEATLRQRVIGLLAGTFALEIFNLLRIVSLYLLGVYKRDIFDMFHLAVWQTVMFGVAVALYAFWTSRAAPRHVVAQS